MSRQNMPISDQLHVHDWPPIFLCLFLMMFSSPFWTAYEITIIVSMFIIHQRLQEPEPG